MTLQQLKYVTTIANIGSISEAAKRLFVSQPSLTKAIKELEKEMGTLSRLCTPSSRTSSFIRRAIQKPKWW